MNEDLKQYKKELHKPIQHNYVRRKVSSFGNDDIFGADLCDVSNKETKNKGITFLLTVIDIYSRFAWCYPLKSKSAEDVLAAFKKLPRICKNLWVDEGKEFYNGEFKIYCKKHEINMYHTNSGFKSVFVERFNRTLKEKIQQHITENRTLVYYNQLDRIMKEYNHTVHSKTRKTPYDVYFGSETPYKKEEEAPSDKINYKVGDYVRITKQKGIFDKGYERTWVREVFKIKAIDSHQLPVMYELEDLQGEDLTGKFYDQELQHTKLENLFLYEKMVKQRTVNKKKEYWIKYEGYPAKFNKWVSQAEYNALKVK